MNKLPVEIIENILDSSCETGQDYINFCLTCKFLNEVSKNVKEKIKKRVQNHLWLLIKKFPEKNWDWRDISRNPNITMEIITDNPDKPWDWYYVSENPNITMEIITGNQINLGIGIVFLKILILQWKL